ncbi:MFS transporter [Haematomicrobium sanguinis]|uniref:MFS transporter n=1 Tax=Haematomicrobium sanguinis TaxID=479106 RepID=UPI0006893FF1|nr:MFS transporter [Haematomicrobium sanguinis]
MSGTGGGPGLRESLDKRRMVGVQYATISLCVALNMMDGFDVLVMAFSATAITNEWGLSASELGILLSTALIGMAIGSIFVSSLADVIGRKKVVMLCVATITVGMTLATFAPGFEVMLVARLITGLAVGTLQACLNVIASEFSSAKARSFVLSIYTMGQPLGGTLGGIVSGILIANFGWRAAFAFGAVVTLILLPLVARFMPESLDYLLTKRGPGALEKVNGILRRLRVDAVSELPPVPGSGGPGVVAGAGAGSGTGSGGRWREVFSQGNLRTVVLLSVGFFTLMGSFYFANSWTPRLVGTAEGFTPADGISAGIAFSIGGIAGTLLFGACAHKFGPFVALIAAFLLSAAAFSIFPPSLGAVGSALLIAGVMGLFTSAATAGMFTVGPISFAPRIRSTAVGLIIGMGRVGAIVSPIVAGVLIDARFVPGSLYYLFVPALIIGGIAIAIVRFLRTRDAANVKRVESMSK